MTDSSPRGPERPHEVLVGPSAGSRCLHRVARESGFPDWKDSAPVNTGVRLRADALAIRQQAEYKRICRSIFDGQRCVAIGNDGDDAANPDDRSRVAIQQTLTAMDEGVDVVWDAVLPSSPEQGRDQMTCVVVLSPSGRYVPVIVVNHKVVDPRTSTAARPVHVTDIMQWAPRPEHTLRVRRHREDTDRLAHAWQLLVNCGHAASNPEGAVLGLGTSLAVVHRLDDALNRNNALHRRRLQAARGELATAPTRTSECRKCPWWRGWDTPARKIPGCEQVLKAAEDVSLVANSSQVTVLHEVGVNTIGELATRQHQRPPGWTGEAYEDTVLRAQAWKQGRAIVPKVAEPHILRADVEVDVDLENYLDDGVYMWGTLLTVRDGGAVPTGSTTGYRSFETWTPLPSIEEGHTFARFWRWLMTTRDEVLEQGRTFAAYCYSRSAEDSWMLATADTFGPGHSEHHIVGMPSKNEVEAFINSELWVDVHAAVASQFVSTVGTGLKSVAPIAGFAWRDDEAGGDASIGWYQEFCSGSSVAADRARERLRIYNEDDVRATLAVRCRIAFGLHSVT